MCRGRFRGSPQPLFRGYRDELGQRSRRECDARRTVRSKSKPDLLRTRRQLAPASDHRLRQPHVKRAFVVEVRDLALADPKRGPRSERTLANGYAIGNAGNPDGTDGAWTNSQVLWNASVGFEPTAVPNLSLQVGCKNCADRTYSVSFLSATSIYLNPPRTWNAYIRYQF